MIYEIVVCVLVKMKREGDGEKGGRVISFSPVRKR
jgi:hypothetical protein